MMNKQNMLSKSRFQSGKQCELMLWQEVHARDRKTKDSESQKDVFAQGDRVGELARERWPGGHLVDAKYYEHPKAVTDTIRLLQNPEINVIFEAGFHEIGVRVRPDVLVRVNGTEIWDMIEVKSSTKVKDEHIPDAAIQAEVIEAAGVQLRFKSILVINNKYRYEGGDLDLDQLFKLEDRTEEVKERQAGIRAEVVDLFQVIDSNVEPIIEPGRHCMNPYPCSFYEHCTQDKPDNWVMQLPRIEQEQVDSLREMEVEDISEIPADFPSNEWHERIRRSVVTGQPWFSAELSEALGPADYPIYILDFEAFSSAIPPYEGTRSYQQIPFQWSCHIDYGDGELEHLEFLADGTRDPRREVIESLIQAVGDTGRIVMYHDFECRIIKDLIQDFPEYSNELNQIRDRLWDLLPVVRNHVYHPDFHGQRTLKKVLPALVPELAYGDLDIQAGDAASALFKKVAIDPGRPGIDDELSRQLKEYCGRDTEGTARVLEYLRSVSMR
jgi:hypothetical protein